jgi:uncharacterized protein (TIGR02611 family)
MGSPPDGGPLGGGARWPGVNGSESVETRLTARLRARRARHVRRCYGYRVAVAAAGFVVFAAGIAMLVLPGPGLLVSAIGLGLLALEFRWAERLLVRVTERGSHVGRRLRRR